MNIFVRLILAIIIPLILACALAYAQGYDSQPETVSFEEVLKSLD